ncbi:MAG: uncharacterized protein KVP18_001107 [Porospora cf. gigantea A]|uniref:uncharacterized protein n=1 Tax=Porospora cf. gigantea A TaxID=2853593 RepID=UPI00355969D9|nr:MAG: hypothetical protein KVP18_001107 [Porospora cf. gigantea A]
MTAVSEEPPASTFDRRVPESCLRVESLVEIARDGGFTYLPSTQFTEKSAVGLTPTVSFTKEALEVVTFHTELRLRRVVETADKFRMMTPGKRRRGGLSATNIQCALESLKMRALVQSHVPLPSQPLIDLAAFATSECKTPLMCRPTMEAHWLMLEGVQPDHAWNYSEEEDDRDQTADLVLDLGAVSLKVMREDTSTMLSNEHRLYLQRVQETLNVAIHEPGKASKEILSRLVESLSEAPGLTHLMPSLMQLVTQNTAKLLTAGPYAGLKVQLKIIEALIDNQSVRLFHYIHQVCYVLLSLLLSPVVLGSDSDSVMHALHLKEETMFILRKLLQRLVAQGQVSHSVFHKLSQILHEHLQNLSLPIPTLLGALKGIRALGPQYVKELLLPILPLLLSQLDTRDEPDDAVKLAFLKELKHTTARCVHDLFSPTHLTSTADVLPPELKRLHLQQSLLSMSAQCGDNPYLQQAIAMGLSMLSDVMGPGIVPAAARGVHDWLKASWETRVLPVKKRPREVDPVAEHLDRANKMLKTCHREAPEKADSVSEPESNLEADLLEFFL